MIKHGIEGKWYKSSRSGGSGECVEVAPLDAGIAVGDTKDPEGPALSFTPEAWTDFVSALGRGELA